MQGENTVTEEIELHTYEAGELALAIVRKLGIPDDNVIRVKLDVSRDGARIRVERTHPEPLGDVIEAVNQADLSRK